MFSFEKLDITGYQGESVLNTFMKQGQPTKHAALILPGQGYSCQGPVLAYPAYELATRGVDVLCVEYGQHPGFATFPRDEQGQCAVEDARAGLEVLLRQQAYEQLTIVGKSLGTLVMGRLLTTMTFALDVRTIWLTPIITLLGLREQMRQAARQSLLVIGDADFAYDADALARVREFLRGEILVIAGADHGLLIQNDTLRSIQTMKRVIEAMQRFLQN